jgi:hypothetical protein
MLDARHQPSIALICTVPDRSDRFLGRMPEDTIMSHKRFCHSLRRSSSGDHTLSVRRTHVSPRRRSRRVTSRIAHCDVPRTRTSCTRRPTRWRSSSRRVRRVAVAQMSAAACRAPRRAAPGRSARRATRAAGLHVMELGHRAEVVETALRSTTSQWRFDSRSPRGQRRCHGPTFAGSNRGGNHEAHQAQARPEP